MSPNLPELRHALIDDAVNLVSHILGSDPTSESRHEARWGSKGSFSLDTDRGLWFDHEAGEGGDLFDLIMRRVNGAHFPDAITWAQQWLGWHINEAPETPQAKPRAKVEKKDEPKDKSGYARRVWARTTTIVGTVADKYLRETRKIAPVDAWPASVRYDPRERAVALAATTDDGTLTGVQIIRLTSEARKIDVGIAKQSYGSLADAVVRFPATGDSTHLCLCEGPETALSVWAAPGYETWAALGSVTKCNPTIGRKIIVCLDDDDRNSPARKKLKSALLAWRNAGLDVVTATPWDVCREDRSDFNDVMQQHGAAGVKARIDLVADPPWLVRSWEEVERTHDRRVVLAGPRDSIDSAREQISRATATFFEMPRHPHAEHGVRSTVGTGKSEAYLKHTIEFVKRRRDSLKGGGLVIIAVATHTLAENLQTRINAMTNELMIEIWRGRGAKRPGGSDDDRMCENLVEVREGQEVLANVRMEVCEACSHEPACAYLAQDELEVDILIVPHQLLFIEHKLRLFKKYRHIAAVIVDESIVDAGIHDSITIPLDALDEGQMPSGSGVAGMRLADIRGRFQRMAKAAPDGPVGRLALDSAGLNRESGEFGAEQEMNRKIEKVPFSKRHANKSIPGMILLWKAVADQAEYSGRMSLGRLPDKTRVIRLTGRKEIADHFKVPTLHMDAMLDEKLLRHHFSKLKVTASIDVDSPHMRVYQVAERSFSKSFMAPSTKLPKTPEEHKDAARRAWNRRKVRAFILKMERLFGGMVLVIGNKATVMALGLPSHIETAWFNNLAGRDEWKRARVVIVIGRPQPPPAAVEQQAGALTGHAPKSLGEGWYQRADGFRLVREGDGVRQIAGETDRHPDPMVERLRWQSCEAEILQAIGRGRGVNRKAKDPLTVFVLSDVVLPIPIDGFLPEEIVLKPTSVELQLAEAGVAFDDASAAVIAYPRLWKSAAAAQRDMHREKSSQTFSYEKIIIRECLPPSRIVHVSYQRAGNGQRKAHALVDVGVVKDPRAEIERLLGPLANFEIVET